MLLRHQDQPIVTHRALGGNLAHKPTKKTNCLGKGGNNPPERGKGGPTTLFVKDPAVAGPVALSGLESRVSSCSSHQFGFQQRL